MKYLAAMMMAMCMTFSLSACETSNTENEPVIPETPQNPDTPGEDDNDNNGSGERTAVTLTVGETVLEGYLNDNRSARDLISRLPVTVSLNRGAHDYCGDITPALAYDEGDVQNGWKNGDLAFWTAGNDFVIFHSDEENSSSTGNIVNIGAVTSDLETVRSLGQNINVTIARAGNDNEGGADDDNNSNEDNDMVTKMRITVNGRTLTATLEDNATTRAIAGRLPMTLPMMNLYGREMCYRFPEALPTDNARTRGYEVGEIVYYPPMHSFVIMYRQNGERFQMQSIGRIDSGVEVFNGIGDVEVRFEKAE
ncbi:cyclophilin-like fold protein [Parabacteroides timonensis]|uniref:cyclophilin-like fold protein n=1 Tax=Parabacteroides timonensis TaxID=1871013 RepID=UPI00137B58C4|nr:cyclophilin-like fold protein [Parabacteroides timonensis]